MKKMRRLLAALLVTTMLFGSNGFSYAAEAVGGDTQEAAQEVAAVEEPESEATEETAPEEATTTLPSEISTPEIATELAASAFNTGAAKNVVTTSASIIIILTVRLNALILSNLLIKYQLSSR